MKRLGALCAAVAFATAFSRVATAQLGGVELNVVEVADSGNYFYYSLELANPSTSTWAFLEVTLDITASAGTPDNLPSTGSLFDLTDGGGSPVEPHAAVGPITPTGWNAILDRIGYLTWSPDYSAIQSEDSIPSGTTKTGFGIRSSYLPGIRDVQGFPTVESCCLQPYDSTGGEYLYPSPADFAVMGKTIGPQYTEEEVTVALLQSQLTAVCTNPLWLDDSALCTEFDGLLDSAATQFANDSLYESAMTLSELLDRVESEQQQMHSNAYWLLYHNIRQAHANIAAAGPGELGVSCSPSSVERGSAPVSCAPVRPIPPLGSPPFQLTGWRFIGGPSNEYNLTPDGTPPETWEGVMVVSGSVWVYGNVEGVADSANTTVMVTPRSWPLPPMDDPVLEEDPPMDLPAIPASGDDLFHYHSRFRLYLSWGTPELHPTIEIGPNRTLTYNAAPVVQQHSPFTEINREALTNNQNPWYQSHPTNPQTDPQGNPICRRQDLSDEVLVC